MHPEMLYVKSLNEIPEIRAVTPGHLVRCGHSSVYDVNFGKEAGGAAVLLLQKGISGVTVVGVNGEEIRYIDTADAIKQRHVNPAQITYHEQLGICFGRNPSPLTVKLKKIEGTIERAL